MEPIVKVKDLTNITCPRCNNWNNNLVLVSEKIKGYCINCFTKEDF